MRTKSFLGIVGVCLGSMIGSRSASAQETWGPSQTIGETPGSSTGMECPTGKYAIGLQVRSGTYIHMIQLECARLGPAGQHESIQLTTSYVGGSSGGSQRQLRCSSGDVMIGFRGREGWWIDRLQVLCKPWRSGVGTDGTTHYTITAGGTGGDWYGPLTCPGRMGIYYVGGWKTSAPLIGTLVAGYWFHCKSA